MSGLLRHVLQSWTSVWLDACGCNQASAECGGPRTYAENVFAVRPLVSSLGEAARATHEGARLLHEGRRKEALQILYDVRALVPGSPEACCNLGCAYQMHGDACSALYWYKEAYALAPWDETAALALALLQYQRGEHADARKLLAQHLRETCQSREEALDRCDQWPEAAAVLRASLQAELPQEWNALQGPHEQPVLAVDRLQGRKSSTPPVKDPLVAAVTLDHSGEEEVVVITHACASPGAFAGPASSLDRGKEVPELQTRAAPEPPPNPLQEARNALLDGNPTISVSLFEGILQIDPGSPEALLGMADCQEALGNLDAALEAGKRAAQLRPDSAWANLRVAELLLAGGHEAAAAGQHLTQARSALGDAPDSLGDVDRATVKLRYWCAAAEAALAREEHKEALAAAQEAVRIDASGPGALALLGRARLHVADYPAALRAFAAALAALDAVDPQLGCRRAAVHALMAQACERSRQLPEALDQAQLATDMDPGLVLARVVRATALQQLGRLAEAEVELRSVLETSPGDVGALLQLGYCRLLACEPDAASALGALVRSGAGPPSVQGAARVYLALALDARPQPGGDLGADSLLADALRLHRNLAHVWGEVSAGPPEQAGAAVQRLRGICDLDLSTLQARQLLRLLAGAFGRHDLASALVGSPQLAASTASTPGARSRCPSSNLPNRWSGLDGSFRSASGASTPLLTRQGSPPALAAMRAPELMWPTSPAQLRSFGTNGPCGPASSSQASAAAGAMTPARRGLSIDSVARSPQPAFRPISRDVSRERLAGIRTPADVRVHGPPAGASERGVGDGGVLTIGRHELIRSEELLAGPLLGAGASAQVFRGSLRGREVAIKKISGIAHLEAAKKEISALRRLQHPRLVRLVGVCIEPPLLVVVTEFVAGGCLHDRLFGRTRNPPLPQQQRWAIGCHVAEGLDFLHSWRVVHRDLKSTNILLGAGGAKICDLGLAQQMHEAAAQISRSVDGEGGSPRYMAPECWDASLGSLTEKMDIWALGCVLLELHGDQLPYAGCASMVQLSARILVEKRPPTVPDTVPAPLAALIGSCCSFDQGLRPTAAEIARSLALLSSR